MHYSPVTGYDAMLLFSDSECAVIYYQAAAGRRANDNKSDLNLEY